MEIIVCVKRVPDLSEVEIALNREGTGLDESDLTYGINEWDNFAVEEAVRIKEQHGGRVTAITVGDDEAEEVLRRALAMGADEALHLNDAVFIGDTIFDLECANKADLRFIGVTYDSLFASELAKKAECYDNLEEVKL